MSKKAERTRFTKEFKADAVRLALSESIPTAQVARDLGIRPNALYNWVAKHRAEHADESRDAISDNERDNERDELRRLRRENRILKEEREILKKAAAFFAKESR